MGKNLRLASRFSRLKEKGWLQNGLLALFFVIFLTCFLYLRETQTDHLELNGTARKYIFSQKGFEFPDTEATHLLREESIRDLGKIYRIPGKEIFAVEKKIQKGLVENPQWRQTLSTVTFDELIRASETLRETLQHIRFTDARTIVKLTQIRHPYSDYIVYSPDGEKEKLPNAIWKKIEQRAFPEQFLTPAAEFILQQYVGNFWMMQEDFERQNYLSQVIKEAIPLKMTKVPPGMRIIDAGDKITVRHVDMMKGMKKMLLNEHRLVTPLSLLGNLVLSAILTFFGVMYLKVFYPQILQSYSKKILIVALVILTLGLARLAEYLILNKGGELAELCRYQLVLPSLTLLLAILIDKKVAILISKFAMLMLCLTLSWYSHSFLIINVVTALMTVVLVKTVRKRKEIFGICAKLWLMTIPMVLAFNMMENHFWNCCVLIDLASTLIWMTITAVLIIVVLPLLESAFGIVTDMTLFESGDLSHPLLRRLNLEAPGTYRHSLAVAALAEEAAIAINASPVFCRVASLFHDIGKLSQPQYFSENQFSLPNVHKLLTPLESAEVIISHVLEGIKLAEEYKLPTNIIDVIREHHGTGLVYYFYHEEVKQCRMKDKIMEESRFRYPGPLPRSRESAVIMLSDSVEAAFRSLETFAEKEIVALVETIVGDKIREHQLDASHLTFDEIEAIKKAFVHALIATSHPRIKYPSKQATFIWRSEEVFSVN